MAGTLRDPLIGKSLGSYHVEKLLGAGAFGRVYLGVHPTIGTKVAIKVLTNSFSDDEQVVHRFISEARAVNVIKHPNIIQIFDFGQLEDERFYCIMEFIEGEELSKLMTNTGCFSLGKVQAILEQIVAGLDAAHEQGIIHRDLKPDNIMVYKTKSGPVIKILDFGIAKLLESSEANSYKTKTGQVMGTPAYMAPEQARGDGTEIGVRCDVYSLGVIVYQMLTGELPITGNSVADLLVNLLIEPPIPLREKVTGLPDALCEMVRRSLSKEQVDRQSTVTQFYDEFLAAIAGAQPELRGVPLNDTLPISDDDSLSSAQTVAASDLASHGATGRTTMPRGSLVSNQTATAETLLASGRSRMPLIFATFSVMTLLIVAAIFIYVKVVPHRKKEAEKPVAPKPVAMAPAPMVAKKKPIKPAKKPVSIPEGYKKMKNIRGSDLCFFMGDEKGEEAEKPAHMVCLSPYAMDRTEVTVTHYAKCVDAGKCSVPKESDDKSEQHNCNWGKKDRASHPVNCVDWNQANNYCQWAKKRLPTEAEWEFAARGKNRNTLFPWGEKSGDCKLSIVWDDGSNMSGCGKGGTWPVGSRPKGASSFGIHDLVGNVWEWVADFYDPGYYKSVASSMVRDPKGPAKPTASRVLRGGAFNTNAVKATFRAGKVENVRMTHIGFRCARTLPPAKK